MMHELGSPAQGIEAGDHRKWFDGWRIATGVLTVPFMAGEVICFASAVRYSNDLFTVISLCFLAIAGSFWMATLIPSGSGGRGVFTVIGLALGYILAMLAVIYVVLLLSFESRDINNEKSWFTYDLGYTAARPMTSGDVR